MSKGSSATNANGDNSTSWLATLFNQLVTNDMNLHQVVAQALARTNQATAEISNTAHAAYAAAQAAQAAAQTTGTQANIGTAEGGNTAEPAETTAGAMHSSKPNIAEPEPFLYQLLANFHAKPQAYTDYHVKIDMGCRRVQRRSGRQPFGAITRFIDKHRRSFDVPHRTGASWDFGSRRSLNSQAQVPRSNVGGRFGNNGGNLGGHGGSGGTASGAGGGVFGGSGGSGLGGGGGTGRIFGGQGQPMDIDHARGRIPTRACFNCGSTTHLNSRS